jgi:hypothetical protein
VKRATESTQELAAGLVLVQAQLAHGDGSERLLLSEEQLLALLAQAIQTYVDGENDVDRFGLDQEQVGALGQANLDGELPLQV